ncbi:MAG: hypothetical protein IPJ40_19675 [Saprospirales bacterium]|nr:hypothetical protein [Saprospirales bacterium]
MFTSSYPPIPCVYDKVLEVRRFRTGYDKEFAVILVQRGGQYGFVGENGVEYFR